MHLYTIHKGERDVQNSWGSEASKANLLRLIKDCCSASKSRVNTGRHTRELPEWTSKEVKLVEFLTANFGEY